MRPIMRNMVPNGAEQLSTHGSTIEGDGAKPDPRAQIETSLGKLRTIRDAEISDTIICLRTNHKRNTNKSNYIWQNR